MNLVNLDKMLPKRWVLLLRYYLPFFKTPTPFYFKCREFINSLRKQRLKDFSMDKLPEFLLILENYSKNNPELINFSEKIIYMITDEHCQQINHHLLIQLLINFNPEDNGTLVLNTLLAKLPAKVYHDTIAAITTSEDKVLTLIKWCSRLADQFSLIDKLTLVVSLPEELISSQLDLINSLVITKLQANFKDNTLTSSNFLTLSNQEKFLSFFLKWKHALNLSNEFLFNLLNPWLQEQNPLLINYLKTLDIETRLTLLKVLLIENNPAKTKIFLSQCPQTQWSALIDKLISYFFDSFKPGASETIILTAKPSNDDPRLWILHYLDTYQEDFSLNLLQFLAITSLTEKTIDITKLGQIIKKDLSTLESEKNFFIELREYLAENRINALKIFMRDTIFITIKKETSRYSIHRKFHAFFTDTYLNLNVSPLDELNLIIKNLPEPIQQRFEFVFNIIIQLLEHLYALLNTPLIVKAKMDRFIACEKARKDFEYKAEARRALQSRIARGQQSSVSYQRMEELFGEQAKITQDKWRTKLGVQFFNAENKAECKAALQEAAATIKFNREFVTSV